MNLFNTSYLKNNSDNETAEMKSSEKIEPGPLGIMTIEKQDIQAPILGRRYITISDRKLFQYRRFW